MSVTAKPRVLAVLPAVVPSTTLGVIKPLLHLQRSDCIHADFRPEYWVSQRQVNRADVIVFCRNVEPAYGWALEWARQARKPVIYDLDDDLLDVPADLDVSEYHQEQHRQEQLKRYLSTANLVRVYSSRLAKKLASISQSVERIDGPIDWRLVPQEKYARHVGAPLRVVYATSRQNDSLFRMFEDDVRRLLSAYPGRFELFLWGLRSDDFPATPLVHYLPFESTYDKFFLKFAASRYDIGLAPLPNTNFYLAKSNNKFREYAACRIAGIYSDVAVYSECVDNEETGLLVPSEPGAWFQAVSHLLTDAALRGRIQEQAHRYARSHYGMEQFSAVWLDQIRSVLKDGARPGEIQSWSNRIPESAPYAARDTTSPHTGRKLLLVLPRPFHLIYRVVRSLFTGGVRRTLSAIKTGLRDLELLFLR